MTSLVEGVRISELVSGSKEEQDLKFSRLVESALKPDTEQLAHQRSAMQARIIKFERRYEMSSALMLQKLSSGAIKETADICSWLMLLKAVDGCKPKSP